MMLAWLFSPLGKLAIGAAIVGAIAAGAYFKGRADERAGMLKEAIEAWEDRAKVEDEIASDDPVALCRRLGGLPDECDGLRRVP